MLLVLAARCATAALRELDQAQRELVYRERQHKLAREALEKVLRALRYPEQKDKPQARVREAADRVLRAQRRAIRAQRDADEWQAEFDATARELVPIYAAALAEEKRANEQAERSRRVWRDAERAAAE